MWLASLAKLDMSRFCGSKHVSSIHTQACSHMPTAGATSGEPISAVASFLLWVFYGTPDPTSILLREKGSFIHSLMACQGAALCICCRGLAWTRRARTPGQCARNISVQSNHEECGGCLGKRHFCAPLQAHCVRLEVRGMAWGSAFLTCSPGNSAAGDPRTTLQGRLIEECLGLRKPPTIMHWISNIISK